MRRRKGERVGFPQNGGLALRPKSMLGKQTLCQLSYSRSEQG
jgi:hypothetical protein